MKLYGIKFKNGKYLCAGSSRHDRRVYTDNIKQAYGYISLEAIERIISAANELKSELDYKGASIVDLETGEIVEKIKIFNYYLKNTFVSKETEKAVLINNKCWLPKAHVDHHYDENEIGISKYIWNEKFKQFSGSDDEYIIDINKIIDFIE